MSDHHSGEFSKMGGKCPRLILANFQKWEENVRMSCWKIFKHGRKMSDCHPGKFSKMGGKCPTVILANFQKWEENVL
jgi:predicted transcriptional regulator